MRAKAVRATLAALAVAKAERVQAGAKPAATLCDIAIERGRVLLDAIHDFQVALGEAGVAPVSGGGLVEAPEAPAAPEKPAKRGKGKAAAIALVLPPPAPAAVEQVEVAAAVS